MVVLLAQLEGLNGWIAAGSTVGLLAPVLYWLCMIHLPAKDRQIDDMIKKKDDQVTMLTALYEKRMDAVTASFKQECKEGRDEFKTALTAVLNHCQEEGKRVMDALRIELNTLRVGGKTGHPTP